MEILNLAQLKRQAQVVGNDDDTELTLCGNAAEESVLMYLNTSYAELVDTYSEVPAVVERAMYTVAVGMFEDNSGEDTKQHYVAPFGVLCALEGYKVLSNR